METDVLSDNLPKVYGLYTGGFLVFIGLMAILEQLAHPGRCAGHSISCAFTIAIYATIGWLSRTMQVDAYYVAGREVPPLYNGMATAADWMSGASFVAMAGGVYFGGYGYLAFIVGWTGGYVLVNSLLAPYLRKFGCYTVPDFIGTRYGGNTARLFAVIVLVVASFTYVTAQINATGTIAARALQIPFEVGVWFGLLGILLCSMLGGMRAVTWTQVAQYIVLIIAYLVPVFWMSNAQDFGLIPQLSYGGAVERISELEAAARRRQLMPSESFGGLRALTTPHSAAPDSALCQLEIRHFGNGADVRHGIVTAYSDALFHHAERARCPPFCGLVTVLYFPACISPHRLWRPSPSCKLWTPIWRPALSVNRLPMCSHWNGFKNGAMSAFWPFLTATAMAFWRSMSSSCAAILWCWRRRKLPVCLMSFQAWSPPVVWQLPCPTADGLLLAIANALSHDLYYKIIDPEADTRTRLIVARVLLVIIGAGGALVASLQLSSILGAVAWAFSFACSGLFFPLVLGVWWKRANRQGAIAGMAIGFLVGSWYLYHVRFAGGTPLARP